MQKKYEKECRIYDMRLQFYKDNIVPVAAQDLDTLAKYKADWRFNKEKNYLEHRTFEKFSTHQIPNVDANNFAADCIIQNISVLTPKTTTIEEEV